MSNPPNNPPDDNPYAPKPEKGNEENPYTQNPNQYSQNINQYSQNPNQYSPYNPQQNYYQNNQQQQYYQNPYQQQYYQNPYQQYNNPYMAQRDLPNASAVLVLGIISILGAFCYGVVGVALGITSLVMGNKAKNVYEMNPGVYSENSYSNVKAGRICAIIGLSIGALILIVFVMELAFISSLSNSF
ncbi:MAG: hypothetical protein HY064_04565 [Bacteroidetes bacterium]|nr:hypothetical protein [Bacteroidota bacterium]